LPADDELAFLGALPSRIPAHRAGGNSHPGSRTATIIRIAARDGRAAALSAVVGNSTGVMLWAVLSAVGVSSLILASEVAYDVLKIGGAAFLIVLGLRSLLQRGSAHGGHMRRRRLCSVVAALAGGSG
jgi:threonine/homoserine/homoserine lactone efflux protein